ncbi:ciliary microtubule associated protein 1A [Amia ocellicauda]|uniref:ciliary microtubule associated protein 1A n=1 Tax=Amia ocellicauda TaxID=2972642 RepID=UPI0034643376
MAAFWLRRFPHFCADLQNPTHPIGGEVQLTNKGGSQRTTVTRGQGQLRVDELYTTDYCIDFLYCIVHLTSPHVSEQVVGSWKPHKRRGPISAEYTSPGPKYALPVLIGTVNHATTKSMAPAYSLGVKHRPTENTFSPGPVHLVPANMTEKGKEHIPAYSIVGRPKEHVTLPTPGPGYYEPEKHLTSVCPHTPAYSISGWDKPCLIDQTPGPAAYSLPSELDGKTGTTMSGRSQIGSIYDNLQKSPGPAVHSAVDPIIYKYSSRHYTMTGRNYMPENKTQKPGPGAHYPERVTVTSPQAPTYSFGIQHSQYVAPFLKDDAD